MPLVWFRIWQFVIFLSGWTWPPACLQLYLHQLALSTFLSFLRSRRAWIHNPCVTFWWVSFRVSVCLPDCLGWKRGTDLAFEKRGQTSFFVVFVCLFVLWYPTVLSSLVKLKRTFDQSGQSKWRAKSFVFSVFFSPCFVSYVIFLPSHWLLLLCHTVLYLGGTPKPSTCSHYCRLFTWHTLKPAWILTSSLTACFRLFYLILVALFQLTKKEEGKGGTFEHQNLAWLSNDYSAYITDNGTVSLS